MNKFIALVLSFVMLGHTLFVPALAVAQEVVESTPAPVAPASTATPEPQATPAASASPEPVVSTEPTSAAVPPATPAPTRPPYSSPEYDIWKAEQSKLEEAEEAREDEWEENEENSAWVEAHGGSEDYYTSGQWQKDEDARKAAELAAQQAQQEQETQKQLENDPFANQPGGSQNAVNTPSACNNSASGETALSTDASNAFGSEEGSGTNSAVANNNDTVGVTNNNCASIGNTSTAGGVSGGNTINNTDGPASMNTGNSSANGQLVNNGNANITDSDNLGSASSSTDDSLAEGTTAENFNTGDDSDNFSQSNESLTTNVNNNNAAYVDNQMDVEATSGVNEVTDNDGDVKLTTGDLELIANMLNILNLNITGDDFMHLIVNIFGQLDGNLDLDDIALALGYQDDDDLQILAANDNTGEDSNNTAEVNHTENTDVNNNNTAVVNNEMNVNGVSGGNNVSNNDGSADLVTGRIKILANMMNFINSNFAGEKWSFIMVNIFGSLNGNIVLPGTDDYLNGAGSVTAANTNPGEDSTNNQSASSTDNTNVSNSNNVQLNNNMNVNGISGNNDQSYNDDDGEHTADTGVVDVQTQLLNFLNFNITGNNWVFLVVNVMGKWMGQIVGYGDEGTMDAPTDGTFAALSVGGSGTQTGAINSNTGEGSNNTANVNSATNTNVNNTNGAVVNNTMNINGISGENTVNHNEEATKITTGWVEIDANLLNIINMNVTGRSWMIVFLNVFGDFNGNMFFGRDSYNQYAAAQNQNNGVGGSSNNQQSNNSQNTTSAQSNESVNNGTTATSVLGTKNGKIMNIYGSVTMNEESTQELVDSYTGVTFDAQTESELPAGPGGILGLLISLFERVKTFFFEAYTFARGIVEPALAYASVQ